MSVVVLFSVWRVRRVRPSQVSVVVQVVAISIMLTDRIIYRLWDPPESLSYACDAAGGAEEAQLTPVVEEDAPPSAPRIIRAEAG